MEGTSANHPQTRAGSGPVQVQPERGGAILALGIVSIVVNCLFFLGIIAWILGQKDLREMDEGSRDPSGRALTRAGMICGIIGTCLAVLGFIWLIFVFLMVVLPAAGGACVGAFGCC
jgi:hypothetical protein